MLNEPSSKFKDAHALYEHEKKLNNIFPRQYVSNFSLCLPGSFGTYTRRKLLEKQNIIATSKAHWNDIVRRAVDECRPTEVLRVGGAGSKVSYAVHCPSQL